MALEGIVEGKRKKGRRDINQLMNDLRSMESLTNTKKAAQTCEKWKNIFHEELPNSRNTNDVFLCSINIDGY